jgi:hypothetical protein
VDSASNAFRATIDASDRDGGKAELDEFLQANGIDRASFSEPINGGLVVVTR